MSSNKPSVEELRKTIERIKRINLKIMSKSLEEKKIIF